jgi:hypothetical protein
LIKKGTSKKGKKISQLEKIFFFYIFFLIGQNFVNKKVGQSEERLKKIF